MLTGLHCTTGCRSVGVQLSQLLLSETMAVLKGLSKAVGRGLGIIVCPRAVKGRLMLGKSIALSTFLTGGKKLADGGCLGVRIWGMGHSWPKWPSW